MDAKSPDVPSRMPSFLKLVFLTFFSFVPKSGKRISIFDFCKDGIWL